MLQVHVIDTPELGDRSYVAHDSRTAVVFDPQRDLDRIEEVLAAENLTCTAVFETHVHNDYVTGGLELSRRTGAAYGIAVEGPVDFEHCRVRGGDVFDTGELRVRAIATPGHTDQHMSYAVATPDEDGRFHDRAVFTGGSMIYGSVGRTDLADPARTEQMTRAQFRSVRLLAELLADDVPVYPTHGFGSFCSAGSATGGTASTIGLERQRNDAFAVDEDAFVSRLITGLMAYPAYYAFMSERNLRGPGPMPLEIPEPVTPADLRQRLDRGDWVVDIRDRAAYAAGHVPGTIGIALERQFATYLGWLMPWGTPLNLVGDTEDQIAAARLQLARIGIDHIAGASTDIEGLTATLGRRDHRRASFDQLAAESSTELTVLDVRRDDERAVSRIDRSLHIPLHALTERLWQVPAGPTWVHCVSGYRASIAAGLLSRAGREVVLIDDAYTNFRSPTG